MKHACACLVLALLSFAVSSEEQVNINTADRQALMETIKGVGDKRAESILQYREQHGPFQSVEELIEVKGINASIIEKNRGKLTVQ